MPRLGRVMVRVWGAALLGLLLLGLGVCAGAQEVETVLGRDSVQVGDTVQLRVRVRAGRGADIFFSDIPPRLGAIELLHPPVVDTLTVEPDYVSQLLLTLAVYDSGAFVVPRIPVLVRHSGSIDTLYSDSILVRVGLVARDSMLADSAGFAIRPLVGPKDQGVVWAEVWPWLVGVLALGAAGFGAYCAVRWYRRRRGVAVVEAPQRPADQVALEQLQALRDREAWRTVGVKYFFTGVTDALRFYIGSVWGIRTMEETTGAIVAQLRRTPACAPERADAIRRTLELADLVKFARYTPAEHECISSVDGAIGLVRSIALEEHARDAEDAAGEQTNG